MVYLSKTHTPSIYWWHTVLVHSHYSAFISNLMQLISMVAYSRKTSNYTTLDSHQLYYDIFIYSMTNIEHNKNTPLPLTNHKIFNNNNLVSMNSFWTLELAYDFKVMISSHFKLVVGPRFALPVDIVMPIIFSSKFHTQMDIALTVIHHVMIPWHDEPTPRLLFHSCLY